ncbi:hypothetical protein BCV70DRAFT_198085 [Testicularia cyperi]|uniref:Transmembrane protein 135 N-terminal domain-containing protein n=1 Tax=Testicularia cyperi TaxID=1882483 RepID=A0A317XTX7_9BASI|nr:hypothetical protein BCV70DRAFT_198085 [Testicularia cyperi]
MSSQRAAALAVSGRSPTRLQLESLLMPAAKAYLLGYIMDILPAILKALIKFVTVELQRIRASEKRLLEERKLAAEAGKPLGKPTLTHALKNVLPSLYKLPVLLEAIVKALVAALGPGGMAVSCFLGMAGWRISEQLVWWPIAKYYALKLSATGTDALKAHVLRRARIASTFVAAALSSAVAMMVLQHQSEAAIAAKSQRSATSQQGLPAQPGSNTHLTIDTTPSWIPKSLRSPGGSLGAFLSRKSNATNAPRIASLAPAGHFLSRLTSLTLPGTPGAPSFAGLDRSPNNTSVSPNPLVEPKSPLSPIATLAPPPADKSGDAPVSVSVSVSSPAAPQSARAALGRPSPTIDLTLFALVRGLDTLVRAISSSTTATKARSKLETAAAKPSSPLSSASRAGSLSLSSIAARTAAGIASQAEGLIFVVCCAQIMWSWFYHPERLPPSYVKWITNLATMDERLLLALRSIRNRKPLVWGYQSADMTPEGIHLLGSLAEELGHPYEWGDPTRLPNTVVEARQMIAEAREKNRRLEAEGKQVPQDLHREGGKVPGFVLNGAAGARGRGEMGGMPCELVHCGTGGASCYRNALLRWIRGWRMSMAIYFPVHLLPRLLFNPRGFFADPVPNLIKVLMGAARSAAFLATFIVGNWFPICLARTALLPRLLPSVPFTFWDAGLGPRLGSIACGFSIFIEEKRKRAEMALYVAPRALFAATESTSPGWLSQGHRSALWAERIVFGAAVGTVVAAGRYRPDLLRGITATMGWVARPIGQPSSGRNYARSQS